MLGRLRMSVDEALHKYAQLSKDVFSERNWLGDVVYKTSKLEWAMKRIIAEQPAASMDAEARMRDSTSGSSGAMCKTYADKIFPPRRGANSHLRRL